MLSWFFAHINEILFYLYATDKFIEALPFKPNSFFEAIGHLISQAIKKMYAADGSPLPPAGK